MAEEPEQVLPQQRAAAAAAVGKLAADGEAGRQEETRVRDVVHQLQNAGGFQRRKGEQQDEGGHELRPDEKRQAHPRHAGRAKLDDGGDEIHRAEQRRRDEQHHADEPERLAVRRNGRRQRRIGSPARLRRAAGNEKAHEHHHAAEEKRVEARHVDARKSHVRRADHQRHDVVAERRERQRHDAEEHHDGAVHRAEGIVKVGRNRAARRRLAEDFFEQRAEHRHRHARMRDLPAHQHHQEKSEQHEAERHETVLDADDLVVGGENILAPETRLVVFGVAVAVVRVRRGNLAERRKLLDVWLHKVLFQFVANQRRQQQRQIND